ncbi:MAG: hypothetical protein AAGG01_04160 [Planctomycetota bacterium]
MDACESDKDLLRVFACLHDGTLDGIRGDVPGLVVMRVDIEYLAETIAPGETAIDVILHDCRVATYELYGSPGRASLTEEPTIGWTLLGAQWSEEDAVVEISCAEGILRIGCGSVALQLGSTRVLSLESLDHASVRYWDAWERKSKRHRDGSSADGP